MHLSKLLPYHLKDENGERVIALSDAVKLGFGKKAALHARVRRGRLPFIKVAHQTFIFMKDLRHD